MTAVTHPKRIQAWKKLSGEVLDVLVIGGGIVGSGIARDGAMRGLRVGLLDRFDFASGTSSRSSRLLHGGIRYLQQGRIGLVRQASVEKKIIHQIAPHLAQPLGLIFPSYRGRGRPLWMLRIGVWLYDLLCGGRNFAPSTRMRPAEALGLLPGLKAEGLAGAVRYFDAFTNDARLVIDTLRSAERHSAIPLNYARFHDARREAQYWQCEIEDVLSGSRVIVRARAVANATGPWAAHIPRGAVRLRLTKGVHIVISRARMPIHSALVIEEGKRILFLLPWGERVIIGTTDTEYNGLPEKVKIDREDVAYLLGSVNEFFPALSLAESDVICGWAGVRPLLAKRDGGPSDISRAHRIRESERGWWDVAGGKLTTYRLMAEETVDAVVKYLGLATEPCRTAHETLLTAEEQNPFTGILPAPFSPEAIQHYVDQEWSIKLEDVLLRRGGWGCYDRLSDSQVRTAARWMSDAAYWPKEFEDAEVKLWLARFE